MNPVFIGGCDRSGTTLLGTLLGAHPLAVTLPEFQFKVDLYHACSSQRSKSLWKTIIANKRLKIWELDENRLDSLGDSFLNQAVLFRDLVEKFIVSYTNQLGNESPTLWVDHTPTNLRFTAMLQQIYPEAKFIHIIRDGRAIAQSVMSLDWGPNTINAVAPWWLSNLSYGFISEAHLSPDSILRIKYEDLVLSSESVLRTISNFLNIEYASEMMTGSYALPKYTAQQHKLIGRKIEPSRINAWKTQLSPRQIEIFENLTGDVLSLLEYELYYHGTTRSISRHERIKLSLLEMVHQQLNKVKYRKRALRYL